MGLNQLNLNYKWLSFLLEVGVEKNKLICLDIEWVKVWFKHYLLIKWNEPIIERDLQNEEWFQSKRSQPLSHYSSLSLWRSKHKSPELPQSWTGVRLQKGKNNSRPELVSKIVEICRFCPLDVQVSLHIIEFNCFKVNWVANSEKGSQGSVRGSCCKLSSVYRLFSTVKL